MLAVGLRGRANRMLLRLDAHSANRQCKRKSATLSRGTFDPYFAAVGFDQFTGDRQPQATTASASPPGVNLAELLEDQLEIFLCDADTGVANGNGDKRPVALAVADNIRSVVAAGMCVKGIYPVGKGRRRGIGWLVGE